MQDINTSLTKMKNDIHDLSDLITESKTNATTAHQELKNGCLNSESRFRACQ